MEDLEGVPQNDACMIVNKGIMDDMESLQKELHEFVDFMKSKNSKLDYDTCVTLYMLNKISGLQQQIDDIKSFLVI